MILSALILLLAGSTIRSMFGSDEGVIQNIAYIEHKTRKEGGFW
jgi:hypothetical protein